MAHFPKRRRWPWRWLPDRCSCGAPRFDRCPDAIANAISGEYAPRGGLTASAMDNRPRRFPPPTPPIKDL
jgi:hypothetical protein